MRPRSLTGPLLLLIVGALFLWRNLHPETPVFDLLSQYWPFLLIGWGLLRLVEVAVWRERRTGGFTGGEVVLVVLICARWRPPRPRAAPNASYSRTRAATSK